MAIEYNNNKLVVESLSSKTIITSPEPSRRNLFSRVLTNDTVMYKGFQVLNNWLSAANGLYYHPLNYYNTDTSQMTSINANFGLSYNFTGQFTYISSLDNTIVNNNFDFDLISNIQYVDSNKSFLIGQGLGYGSSTVFTLLSASDKFYIGGSFGYFNDGMTPNSFARINPNGSQDYTLFNQNSAFTGFSFRVAKIIQDRDGKIIVGGFFTRYNSQNAGGFIRLNYDGSVDPSLSASGSGFGFTFNTPPLVRKIVLDNNNKMIVGGYFNTYNSQNANSFIRLNYDGSVDPSLSAIAGSSRFSGGPFPFGVNDIAVDSNNKIVVGGFFDFYNFQTHLRFIRLNYDGSIDTSLSAVAGSNRFSGVITSSVNSILLEPDGKMVIGGYFTTYNSQAHNHFIRLNYDGSIDTSLSAVAGSSRFSSTLGVNVVKKGQNNTYLVGGNFTSYNGQTHNGIIRLNYDGSVDNSFNSGTGFDLAVEDILELDNGKILVGGSFTRYNGEPARGIILLNSDGTSDTAMNEKFMNQILVKVTADPGASSLGANEGIFNRFVPTVQDGQICIGSVWPISFATLDYTLISNYGSGTIGFGSS